MRICFFFLFSEVIFLFFLLCYSKGHWGYYWNRSTCVLVPFCFIFSYLFSSVLGRGGFFCAGRIIHMNGDGKGGWNGMVGGFINDVSMRGVIVRGGNCLSIELL